MHIDFRYQINLKGGSILSLYNKVKTIALVVLLFVLQACSNPIGNDCIFQDEVTSRPVRGPLVVKESLRIQVAPDGKWYQVGSAMQNGAEYFVTGIKGIVPTCRTSESPSNKALVYELQPAQNTITSIYDQILKVKNHDMVVVEIIEPNSAGGPAGNKIKLTQADIEWREDLWVGNHLFSCERQYGEDSNALSVCKENVKTSPANYNPICTLGLGLKDEQCWYLMGEGMRLVIREDNPANQNRRIKKSYGLLGGFGQVRGTEGKVDVRTATKGNMEADGILGFISGFDEKYTGGYTARVNHIACPAFNGHPSVSTGSGRVALYVGMSPSETTVPDGFAKPVPEEKLDEQAKKKYKYTAPRAGGLYVKIDAPDQAQEVPERSEDNVLTYEIEVETTMVKPPIADALNDIVNFVRDRVLRAAQSIYEGATCTGEHSGGTCFAYLTFLRLLLTIYIAVYGIMFVMGMVNVSQLDIVIRALKIGTVLTLTQENSWAFFRDYFLNIFIEGSLNLYGKATGSITGSEYPWAFVDDSLNFIIRDPFFVQALLSLSFASLVGLIYFVAILYGLFQFLKAIFHAIKTYIFSILVLGFLVSLGPIFIPMILFEKTKELFQGWIKLMVRYSLEPIIFITGIVVLNQLAFIVLKRIVAFGVCWGCIFRIPHENVLGLPIGICINFFRPWGAYNGFAQGLYMILPLVIVFIALTTLMVRYIGLADLMVKILTQSFGATSSITGRGNYGNVGMLASEKGFSVGLNVGGRQYLKSKIGIDDKSRNKRAVLSGVDQGVAIDNLNTVSRPNPNSGRGRNG